MTVSIATLGQGVFSALRTLIIANKPSYTFNGTVYTYTLVAEYPKDDAVFPCVVLNDADGNHITITLDAATGDTEIEVTLDFYALEAHGIKAISVGKDGLRNTFIANIPTFISSDKLIPQENFWTDSGGSPIEDRNQVINTSSSTVRFKLG